MVKRQLASLDGMFLGVQEMEAQHLMAIGFTVAAVLYAAYFIRRQIGLKSETGSPCLPGQLQPAAQTKLVSGDLGAGPELIRDFARAYRGNALYLISWNAGNEAEIQPLKVPDELISCDLEDLSTRTKYKVELAEALKSLDGTAVPAVALLRLMAMLSVGPAFAVLSGAGCLPLMQAHRFIILHTSTVLRAITVGFVGATPQNPRAQWMLTIASPNLLAPSDTKVTLEDSPGLYMKECILEHRLTPRLHNASTMDEEIDVAAVGWREAFLERA
uniref:Uncharacterized protein n=1 Tax=Chrysotila carterae TaxID=13221 RepID=A0A7S4C200_CHRCT|mmetsp:Transcript_21391/g.45124  ORF Transcript_21391/g.45124 Transcript_21391/m.45124 type:complete len:273 (+) Transcript_21391:280-1098(+)